MKALSILGYGIDGICRVCLTAGEDLININTVLPGLEDSIKNNLLKLVPIQINPDDELPKQICKLCCTELERFHSFQTLALRSEVTLNQYLENIHSKKKYVDFDDNNVDALPDSIEIKSETLSLCDDSCENFTSYYQDSVTDSEDDLNNEYSKKSKSLNVVNLAKYNDEVFNEKIKLEIDVSDSIIDMHPMTDNETNFYCDDAAPDILLKTDNCCKQERDRICADSYIITDNEGNVYHYNQSNNSDTNNAEICCKIDNNNTNRDDIYINSCILNCNEDCYQNDKKNCKNVEDCDKTDSNNQIRDNICMNSFIINNHEDNSCRYYQNECDDKDKHENAENCCQRDNQNKDIIDVDKEENDHCNQNESFENCKTVKTMSPGKENQDKNCIDSYIIANYKGSFHHCNENETSDTEKHENPVNNCNTTNRTKTGQNRDKNYKCDVCNRNFTYMHVMKVHKRLHTGEKPYKCDVCDKCFAQSGPLKVHKRLHTGEKPYHCDICDMCFTHLVTLKIHKLLHAGEKPYKCDVCNKCFVQSGPLKIHKRLHTGEKPYSCTECHRSFTHLGTLKGHKLRHTGEKPFKCDVCEKCLTTSSNLKLHKRLHTGERPYKCNNCNNSFISSNHLKTHKCASSGEESCTVEKLYKCELCNKCLATSNNLKVHKRLHTGERPYTCDVCKKGFVSSNHLRNHKCHSENNTPHQFAFCANNRLTNEKPCNYEVVKVLFL